MKTCPQCGRSFPDAQLACHECGVRLPDGAAALNETVAHIDFLLTQLSEWVLQGWVAPTQARQLYDEYVRRRTALLSPQAFAPRPAPAASQPLAASLDPGPVPAPIPAPEPRPSALAAFLEQSNLSLWHIVGAMLLLAGVAGLVRWTWGTVGRGLVFLLLAGLTGGLFALARSRMVREHRITATAFTAIAALLVPLDLLAAHAFGLIPVPLSTPALGLAIALLCLPLDWGLARRPSSRAFVVILLLDTTAGVHFLMQLLLPGLLHTRDPLALLAAYGVVFVPLAFVYVAQGRRETDKERRDVWLIAAHVTALTALVLAVLGGGASAFGSTAATLLLGAVFYAGTAWLLDEGGYATLACGLALAGSVLLAHRAGLDWSARWYAYTLLCLALALVFGAAGWGMRALGRPGLSAAYRETRIVAAGLALIVQAVRLVFAVMDFPGLPYARTELGGALLAAAVSLAFWARLGPRPIADGAGTYLICLLGAALARWTPPDSLWHRQPHWGLWLAVAVLPLTALGRRHSGLVVGALGLLFAVLYALWGGFLATTVLALLLLTPLFAWQALRADDIPRNDRQAALIGAVLALTLLVLLGQSRALPFCHTHFGWEPNAGDGLFALAVGLLGLSQWRRLAARDSTLPTIVSGAAWLLGGVDALLQLGYAPDPAFAFSPLALLGAGGLLAAGVGLARRSLPASAWAMALAVGVEAAFLLGDTTHPREWLATALLLTHAALFVFLARRLRRDFLTYSGALLGTCGYVQAVHALWAPPLTAYPLALLPVAAALYVVGAWLGRHDAALWKTPLQTSGLLASLLALVPAAVFLLDGGAHPADNARILTTLLGYGALYALAALGQRQTVYLYLMAFAWDGAYLFALLRHRPRLPLALLGFDFALAALLWLTGATLALWLPGWGRGASRPLSHVATAVALLAVVLALAGVGGDWDRYAVYTLLVAGTVFLGSARRLGQGGWQHAGIGAYLLAYFAFLSKRLGAPGLTTSDFYLIPVGLYVLALGFLSRRRTPQANRQPFYLAGLLLVLTPTFLAARQSDAGPWHAPLLATECVLSVFAGITRRIRALVVGGVGFLVALVASQFQGYLTQIHWAIYATLLGLAIIASALFFENRRDAILRWTQGVQERLRSWE